jgi:hypothetical protein
MISNDFDMTYFPFLIHIITKEQSILEALETEVDASNIWERVTKLVDVSQEVPAESTKADTTRMRKLFIQLKNEPLSAK